MKRARELGGLLATSERRDGVALFARELERRFGCIKDLFEEPSVKVITRSFLNQGDLADLFAHQACAVHVPGFYPVQAAASAAARLEGQSTQNWKVSSPRGLESSDVLSVGKPFNVAASEGPESVAGEVGGGGVLFTLTVGQFLSFPYMMRMVLLLQRVCFSSVVATATTR